MYFSTWKSVILRRQNTAAMSARPSAHGYIPRRLCEIYSARDINPIAARQKFPSSRNPSRHTNARQHFSGEMDRPVPTILLPRKPPPSQNSTMPPHGKCQSGLSALCFSSATQTFAEPGSGRAHRRGAEMDFVRTVFIQYAQTSAVPDSGHAPPARCGEALLGCLDLVPEIQPRLVGFFRDRLLEI